MKTVLRYPGGKSKAFTHINQYIPKIDKIVSPFIGGGSLEVKWASSGIKVIGYDIFYHLVNFWDNLLHNKNELLNELYKLKVNKDDYNKIKEILLCWDKTQILFKGYKTDYYKRNPIELSDVIGAAYYFYNFQLSYGPMFLGWFSSNYNQKKYNDLLKRIEDFNVPLLEVYNNSFENIIPKHNNDFLYLDPPYYLEKDKDNKMFKGIYPNSNFDFHHTGFDHSLLRDLLYKHKGGFVLSYNNCETIRNYYKDFIQIFPKWQYSFGNGETRIGKNRKHSTIKNSHEILIINYTDDQKPIEELFF